MRIGVLGQGRLGRGLAANLNRAGHEVFSWSRTPRQQLWANETINRFQHFDFGELDSLVIASGSSSPKDISVLEEQLRTVTYVSKLPKEFSGSVYYLSTGAVYGECLSPKLESDACEPSTSYGSAKLSTEKELRAIRNDNLSVLRIGNIIPMDSDFGIFEMIKRNIVLNKPISLFGSPGDSRDYLDEMQLLSILQNLILSQQQFDILNIGSGVSVTLEEITNIVSSVYGNKATFSWNDRNSFDLGSTQLDIKFLNSLIGSPFSDPLISMTKLFANDLAGSTD